MELVIVSEVMDLQYSYMVSVPEVTGLQMIMVTVPEVTGLQWY